MAQAQIVTLILTTDFRGTGTKENISRRVAQLFTLDGDLVAEFDPCGKTGNDPSGLATNFAEAILKTHQQFLRSFQT